jgi:hypothetical protein
MIGSVGAAATITFNPTDATDIPQASVQARFQVAAIKNQQDMMRIEGNALAQMIDPNKGTRVDAYA